MKRQYSEKLTFEALYKAYTDCRKHKGSTAQAIEFDFEREKNLRKLYEDLINNTYEIDKSLCFIVTDPKPREIWAGAFRDRIVHHLIYNAIYKRFSRKFIFDTFSCLPNRGTLMGTKRAAKCARNITQNYTKEAYFIKMDIRNYFVSINKEILFNLVLKEVSEDWLIDLIKKVIFHDPRTNYRMRSTKEEYALLPPYKSLFNCDETIGLPIGNLTSQFFSNIYLNVLDQYAKHELKCRHYFRYVDDILIIDKEAGFLNYAYSKINRFLEDELKLKLNHKKKCINKVDKGFDFIGHVIKPEGIFSRVRTKNKCQRIINEWNNNKNKFELEVLKEFRGKINSYFGLFGHTNSYNLRKEMSKNINTLFARMDENYSKLILANELFSF